MTDLPAVPPTEHPSGDRPPRSRATGPQRPERDGREVAATITRPDQPNGGERR